MNESILKKIKSLPPMPETVTKIQLICNNTNSSIGDLIKVVEKDPSLVANLLKAANSPLYGFSREIKNVSQAVSLFGMATVKGFAIASAVRSSFKMDLSAYGLTTNEFVSLSEQQNALAINWYKQSREKLDVLAPASFLLEIGMVVAGDFLKKEGKDKEFLRRLKAGECRVELENEFMESSNEAVAAKIFEHWNFEAQMVDSIMYMDDPSQAPEESMEYAQVLKVVKMCVNIKNRFTEESIADAKALIKKFNLDITTFDEALARIHAC